MITHNFEIRKIKIFQIFYYKNNEHSETNNMYIRKQIYNNYNSLYKYYFYIELSLLYNIYNPNYSILWIYLNGL